MNQRDKTIEFRQTDAQAAGLILSPARCDYDIHITTLNGNVAHAGLYYRDVKGFIIGYRP